MAQRVWSGKSVDGKLDGRPPLIYCRDDAMLHLACCVELHRRCDEVEPWRDSRRGAVVGCHRTIR